ncbi:MAG: adenine phosphoribosyltransferase [Candidatus Omnitrophica bacterium]|nr:adenine phosphoribosyltransferase [Candidatus Omnitrophota bacterium]
MTNIEKKKNSSPQGFNPESLKKIIRDIPDFPKKGIIFKDITPLLKHPEAFRHCVDLIAEHLKSLKIDYVIGIESRGFIFSPLLAYNLNVGFVPVRKQGKLPSLTHRMAYALEYGEAVLEIHQDAIHGGARVAIVDDLLATGGTALAAANLVEKIGGKVVSIDFLIELEFLKGRGKLANYDVFSILKY